MRLIAFLVVGNSSDVLAGCIEHHRALGVDEFVILHIHSDDDTPQQLERLSRGSRSIHTVFASWEEAMTVSTYDLLLDRIRNELSPDWIVRFDGDERWLVSDGTLKEALDQVGSDVVTAPRYNAVWPSEAAARHVGGHVLSADDLPLAAYPVAVDFAHRDIVDVIPWVLTKVGPKSCIRAGATNIGFDTGGHYGVDQISRRQVPGVSCPNVMVAQLAFTVRERFERKLRVLGSRWAVLRQGWSQAEGWHWDRLAQIYRQGDDAIQAEWDKQFMTPALARELVGREVIINATDAFGV